MDETANLSLPLVQGNQAQKHVTVNEALVRLDGAVQLVLEATSMDTPPAGSVDGACFGVGQAPTGDWTGQAGMVAVSDNGGWTFLSPKQGWRAWDIDQGRAIVRADGTWTSEGLANAPSGAAARFVTEEVLHNLSAGPHNVTSAVVPANVTLFAVSARVVADVMGTATSWRLGEAGSTDRFGSGLGLTSGSYTDGLLGQPLGYYSASSLVITGEGGDLASGQVRIAMHYLAYDLPGM